jgi:hypothetical protein
MKKTFYLLLVTVVAASVWPAPAARGQDGLQLLPENTDGVLTINSIEELYLTFGIEELRAAYPDDFLELKEEMIDEIGVDLFDLQALREFGFEPAKPIHLGFVDEPTPVLLLLLPSTGDAEAFIRSLPAHEGAGFTTKVEAHGVEIYGDEDEEAAVYAQGSYIAIVMVDEDDSEVPAVEAAKEVLAAVKKGTLNESKPYKKALKKIPGDADFTLYMGPDLYDELMEMDDEEWEEQDISVEEKKELFDRWGLSNMTAVAKANLESKRLVVESFTWVDKNSEFLDWYQVANDPTGFLGRVPSDPMLAIVGRLNFAQVWESLEMFDDVIESDSIPDFDDTLDETSDDIGVDIEDDLLSQLDGNVVFLISQIQMMGNDAVILFQLTRPQEFRNTLTTLVEEIDASIEVNPSEDSGQPNPELLREKYKGRPYYTFLMPPMVEISFGVVEDHLVVASSRTRFKSIADGDGSFVERIGNDEIKSVLADRSGNAFYMDFQKIAANLQMWAPMLGDENVYEIIDVLNEMEHLVGVSRLADDGFWQKMTFTGARPEIWKRLMAAVIENVPDEEEIEMGDQYGDDMEDEN